jgi:ATP-binding cassette subfamily G (WHITE) protein 2 (PDR)
VQGPDGSSQETLVSDGRDDAEVLSIARRVTQQAGTDKGPFGDTSPELDPHSEKFNAKAWVSSLLSIAKQDSGRFPQRTSGIAFRNLSVHGYGTDADYQKTVGNFPFQIYGKFQELFGLGKRKIDILHGFDGVVKAGELLVVLGPPGSGCSTLLKTISGETNGIYVSKDAQLNYQGISAEEMHTRFRGEAIYTAEVDEHFPQLTVGETLTFAASARMHKNRPDDVKRSDIANHLRDAVMAIFGISHTVNTRVGNDFVRGVSGGERKRVTVSEAVLSGAPLVSFPTIAKLTPGLKFCPLPAMLG